MRISVLRSVEIDGNRVSRRIDRVVLIALVAADGRPVSRRVLELIINPTDRLAGADRQVSQSLSRLGRIAGDALHCERGGPASLALASGSTDVEHFERAADRRAIASIHSASARIEALRSAVALCPADLWADLHEFVAADPHYLRPQKANLLRQRRALLTELTFELLRAGDIAGAIAVRQEAAADEDWEYDPIAQLSVVHAHWADGDHVEANVVLGAIERFYRNNQTEPDFDLIQIRDRIRRSVEWSVAELPSGLSDRLDLHGRLRADDARTAATRAGAGTEGPLRKGRPGPAAPVGPRPAIEGDTAAEPVARSGSTWNGRPHPPRRTVGRSHDVHHVVAAMRASPSRSVNPFIVKGPSGIGRSRFLDEIERALSGMGWAVASTRCVQNLSAPLGAAIDLLCDVDPDLVKDLSGDPSDPRYVVTVANALLALATHAPCGILIDDAQFADPASLAALEVALARRTTGYPLWIVLSHNPDATEVAGPEVEAAIGSIEADRRCEQIVLRPFTDREVAVVVEDIIGLPLDVADCWSLGEVTEGCPADVVRALFDLADAGMIRLDQEGCFFAEGALSFLTQPAGGSVSTTDAELADALCIFGSDSRVSDLATVLGQPATEVVARLSRLPRVEIVGSESAPRVRFNIDEIGRAAGADSSTELSRRTFEAVVALAHRSRASSRAGGMSGKSVVDDRSETSALSTAEPKAEPDAETDAVVSRLCGVLDRASLVAIRAHSMGDRSTPLLVAEHLQRHARRLQSAGGWVGAAKVWDLVTVVVDDVDQSLAAAGMAGRCWLRAHDGGAAEDRLTRAMQSSDQMVRGAATIDLCRTYSSISLMEHQASDVIDLVEGWRTELETQPGPTATDVLTELAGIAAERLAVERRYEEARSWVAKANESMRPDCPNLTRGMVSFAAGVVEILAANHAEALAHFSQALALADGDGWLIAWCAARTLVCRAVVQPLDVRPNDVVQAKSLALGVLSWSDVLMTAVAATQIALVQSDVGWALAEMDEAVQTENRASYALTAKGLRLLFAAATAGSLHEDGDGWLIGIGRTWALTQRASEARDEEIVAEQLLSDIAKSLDDIDADASSNYLDTWSVALVAIVADLVDGHWDALMASSVQDGELPAIAKRALDHVDALTAAGEYAVLGVPVPLHKLAARLRQRV